MFSFFPQLLILLAIAGIIVIVLRRTPEVRDKLTKVPLKDLPKHARDFLGSEVLPRGKSAVLKTWGFVKEVKTASTNRFGHLPKKFPHLHLPKNPIRMFRATDSPEFYLGQAEESLERQDYADAERKFIKVIEKDAKNEAAYEGLGKIYLSQKKFEDAVETYKFLIKHFPDNDNYHSKLGQAYHGSKLYDQAIAAYERAIEISPGNARRYVNLGLTLEALEHAEEAILNYRRAVELEKENTQFLLVLAEALAKKGDKEEAEALLEHILQIEPTNHLAREKLMALKF